MEIQSSEIGPHLETPEVLAPKRVYTVPLIIILTAVITAILVGGAVYLWQQRVLQDHLVEVRESSSVPSVSEAVTSMVASPLPTSIQSSEWQIHTNQAIGFTMKIPQKIANQECQTFVPLTISDNAGQVEVTPEYTLDNNCQKIPFTKTDTSQSFTQDGALAHFWVATVTNRVELDKFFQRIIGPDCKLTEERLMAPDRWYYDYEPVNPKANAIDVCPYNGVEYYKKADLAFWYDLPLKTAVTFPRVLQGEGEPYDLEVVNSIQPF